MSLNNKVYINPNFNVSSKNNLRPQNIMHVNKNFPQVLQNKNRIYVNPNFVGNNSTCVNIQNKLNYPETCTNITYDTYKRVAVATSIPNRINVNPKGCIEIQPNITKQYSSPRSRYSFVKPDRFSTIKSDVVLKSQENLKPKITVQINKYKSVAFCNYKKSLDTANKNNDQPSCSYTSNKKLISPDKSTVTTLSPQHNIIKRSTKNIFGGSKYVSLKIKSPIVKNKLLKRNMKKNNIPCPLFKKYGKCLRSMHSKCEFLHDKKHVSVCRKFLKGICHEEDCLLSHDITNNKMPTCYFYLKGLCTRDGCPYLHVKLNDKTKVCTEFLKGYCDKGEKCLNRHINSKACNANKVTKQSSHSPKIKKPGCVYKGKQMNKNLLPTCEKTEQPNIAEDTDSTKDTRYYKEIVELHDESNEKIEVLKPTRCKLGTLPSFIKL